ncbi:MAG: hypothetical protein KAW14_04230 [Candidatus Aegiribacteria sp.]|nr:hypothetical protein [Candidatus Aegiribacteria sp.]
MLSDFNDMCEDAVKRFIKTVVIIDDEATYNDGNQYENESPANQNDLSPPATGFIEQSIGLSHDSPDAHSYSIEDPSDNTRRFLVRKVINRFSDMGIICCVQRPIEKSIHFSGIVKLASTADVFVVDWKLDSGNRRLTCDLIKCIMKKDLSNGGRLRLIIVYTAQRYVDQMLKDVVDGVKEVYGLEPYINSDVFYICHEHLRIVFINKEETFNPLSGAQIVGFTELPDAIISEFKHMIHGIISSATLHIIAAMREKTHQLLTLFNQSLDGAYCSHRAMIPEPSDSVDFVMGLISSEIETILQADSRAREIVDRKGLRAWFLKHTIGKTLVPENADWTVTIESVWNCIEKGILSTEKGRSDIQKEFALEWARAKAKKGAKIKLKSDGREITIDEAENMINAGRYTEIKSCSPPSVLRFAETMYPKKDNASEACNELARLQCTARDTSARKYLDAKQVPTLQLGTILMERTKNKENHYFLCLHPPCDSVGLKLPTNYLFIRLLPGNSRKADFVLKSDNNDYTPLVLRRNGQKIKLRTLYFDPINRDRVYAYRWRSQWRFRTNEVSYRWMAELRKEKAQAIVHRVAMNTSRVGMDEFEWLRQQASK